MTVRQFLAVVEIRTKVVSVSTFSIAALYAWHETGRIRPWPLVLSFVAVLAVDMGTTAFNSFFDWWRGNDARSDNSEADKVILHEHVPALAALIAALACYALGAILGIVLAFRTGPWILVAGMLSFVAGFLYNGGPFPISRTPFGELVSGGFLGTVLFMIVYRVQTGSWDMRAFLASLPGMLMIASILSVNNTCDMEVDRASGRRTLSLLMGKEAGERLVYALGATAFAASLALALVGVLPLSAGLGALAAACGSIPIYRGMRRRGYTQKTKGPSMRGILKVFGLWSLCSALGLALGFTR
jgi:1,4-dihydroxy-2-naphthoate octaprenyltransferase